MLPDRPPTVPHLPPPTAGCHPAAPVVEKSVISGVVGETPGVHVGAAVVPPVELDPPELVVPPVLDEPPLDDELLALDDPPWLDELPVAVCPPVFWFPLEFVLLQFAIAAAKAKHPIHAVIVEKIVAVFPMFPALS